MSRFSPIRMALVAVTDDAVEFEFHPRHLARLLMIPEVVVAQVSGDAENPAIRGRWAIRKADIRLTESEAAE